MNLNEILPGPGQGQSSDPLMQQQTFRHPSSAGPHQTTFDQASFSFGGQPEYLTADGPMRRVRSEGAGHQRQTRSLDIRSSTSLGPNAGLLFPPPGPAQQDFIRGAGRFLHPSEPVPRIGHHRRSSSGSRERGGLMGAGGLGMGPVQGWNGGSSASSARASPYPSPSASPRPGYGALPPQDMGLAGPGMGAMGAMGMAGIPMGIPGSLSGQMGMSPSGMATAQLNAQMAVVRRQGGVLQVDMPGPDGGVPMTVTRPHVTTPSTAKASHDRRKQPANFACPVPGCGSTFTRHFNLKGTSSSFAVLLRGETEEADRVAFLPPSPSLVRPAPIASSIAPGVGVLPTCRPSALARGREALSVQVARMRQGLRAAARLQAARAAPSQHPAVPLRGVQEELCADGRAQPAP